ncbi:patatin-like phospholipase family protein [Aliiglaciecola sp. LCG003]|uniref:patatin-like phospholipase family protein n=1 Tax=Aliiglaciecola sp. LCG003 TaxID=3053655 RepID=UPI002573B459|nr:patatin-like phospholipase family protein [Aliiglaciecola sp. LCG003]WJG07979.1 patatin-like phospholipase family protein [Aliiglaciecola sp. LCG003]
MQLLDIYAGPTALKEIKEHGLKQELFDYMLGASGGPKWFSLAGLDRVVFSQFFAERKTPLHIVGSSAGAFRFACFAQNDPVAAINRLADKYSHTTYADKPTAKEITLSAIELLDYVLGENGMDEIIHNPIIKAHFVVARCKGLTKFENRPVQMAGLIASAGANFVSRRHLKQFYQRYVFASPSSELVIHDPNNMPTYSVELSKANLTQALMASGSIPIVIEGVRNINGAPAGMYRDGGIIDYHFDLTFGPSNGLVFYPHFYPKPIPGWFDKSLRNRLPHKSSYDKVVMAVPSAEFVTSLPYQKIPDRTDFETMPAQQRIDYWQKVIKQSDQLGEAFLAAMDDEQIADKVKPFVF